MMTDCSCIICRMEARSVVREQQCRCNICLLLPHAPVATHREQQRVTLGKLLVTPGLASIGTRLRVIEHPKSFSQRDLEYTASRGVAVGATLVIQELSRSRLIITPEDRTLNSALHSLDWVFEVLEGSSSPKEDVVGEAATLSLAEAAQACRDGKVVECVIDEVTGNTIGNFYRYNTTLARFEWYARSSREWQRAIFPAYSANFRTRRYQVVDPDRVPA